MQHVDDGNHATLVEGSDLPVVLDFGATWCGPCKKLEPILEEMSGGFEGRVRFYKVDVGEAPETARKYGVMGVPTVIFLKDGKPVHRFAGVESRDKITKMLTQHLGV
jgi:thioredoxin 1